MHVYAYAYVYASIWAVLVGLGFLLSVLKCCAVPYRLLAIMGPSGSGEGACSQSTSCFACVSPPLNVPVFMCQQG